nr:hypothetical protein [Enterococcus faecium]
MPTLTNEFFMHLLKGIEDHFNRSDYVFYIASSDDNPKKEEAALRKLYESNAEIIVLATIGNNEKFIQELIKMRANIIGVDRLIDTDQSIDFIGETNQSSAYKLTINFLTEKKLKTLHFSEDMNIFLLDTNEKKVSKKLWMKKRFLLLIMMVSIVK